MRLRGLDQGAPDAAPMACGSNGEELDLHCVGKVWLEQHDAHGLTALGGDPGRTLLSAASIVGVRFRQSEPLGQASVDVSRSAPFEDVTVGG